VLSSLPCFFLLPSPSLLISHPFYLLNFSSSFILFLYNKAAFFLAFFCLFLSYLLPLFILISFPIHFISPPYHFLPPRNLIIIAYPTGLFTFLTWIWWVFSDSEQNLRLFIGQLFFIFGICRLCDTQSHEHPNVQILMPSVFLFSGKLKRGQQLKSV
jgi:hypothetical protein